MYREELTASALGAYEDDARFGDRLAALAAYRELRERRRRKESQPGDRRRLSEARRVLERTGGIPAEWRDPR